MIASLEGHEDVPPLVDDMLIKLESGEVLYIEKLEFFKESGGDDYFLNCKKTEYVKTMVRKPLAELKWLKKYSASLEIPFFLYVL